MTSVNCRISPGRCHTWIIHESLPVHSKILFRKRLCINHGLCSVSLDISGWMRCQSLFELEGVGISHLSDGRRHAILRYV